MKNSLVYVDTMLVVPFATKLLGSTISISKTAASELGFDWFLKSKAGIEYNREIQANIVDFFAEDIFNMAYEKLDNKTLTVNEFCCNVQSMKYHLSDIVSISGILTIPNINIGKYNPFDPPLIVIEKTYKIGEIECFIGQLSTQGFDLPIYFPISSQDIICYCVNKSVEIVGVLKWSPTYEVSSYALNQTVLAVALLLLR